MSLVSPGDDPDRAGACYISAPAEISRTAWLATKRAPVTLIGLAARVG
jgi:hypothetical protein